MTKYDDYKKDVLDASLWLSEQGYFGSHRGTGGNVSVRIDEASMVITPSSVRYNELSVDDICVTCFDLSVIEAKDKLKPSVESGMHSIVYRMRPDVNAVIHTHQIYGSVFALINTPIPALFDEVAFSLGQIVEIIPYALSGSPELVNNVAGKLSRIMAYWPWARISIRRFCMWSFWRRSPGFTAWPCLRANRFTLFPNQSLSWLGC